MAWELEDSKNRDDSYASLNEFPIEEFTWTTKTTDWKSMYEAKISTGKTPIIQDLSKRPWDLSAMKDSEVRAMAR